MDKKLRTKILNEIKPTPKEHQFMLETANKILSLLKKSSKKLQINCTLFIGGSFGKDTYLKNSSDIDLFVGFNPEIKNNKLSELTKKLLIDSNIDYKLQKGSRDYFSFNIYNKNLKTEIKIEIVPNYNINNEKEIKSCINSTDVSPFHVSFLKKKIMKNKDLNDEIRLAKQFFKAKGLYGAESYIQGFSGHIIDILIANSSSLENLLNYAKNWGEETIIDINNKYKNNSSAKKSIDKDKISHLIIVDPIIKTRNAAKALSEENYYKFLLIAQSFDEFREEDFKIKKFNLIKTLKNTKKYAKKTGLKGLYYIFDLKHDESSLDIIGSKLLKLNKKQEKMFKSYDFNVFSNEFYIDMKQKVALFIFLFENIELVKIKKIMGPKVFMKDAILNFNKSRDYIIVEGDRVYSHEQRKITNIKQISDLTINDCQKILNKEVSFIKKIKICEI